MEESTDRINQIVIVGAGLAGMNAAEELRKIGHDGPITLLGGEEHLPYDRPPLSKDVMLGKKALDEIDLHSHEWFADHDITLRTGTAVTGLDLAARQVMTGSESFGYDRLLLATGSRSRHLPMADDAGVDVHYLRNHDDAAALKDRLAGRMVIIGGGWIGLELAAAAREAGGQVVVVESAALPLVGVLGPEVAEVFTGLHREHGVDVRTDTTLRGLQPGANGASVALSDGTEMATDTVLVAIGAEPNVELAQAAGLSCSNGIDVDARLRTSDPHVYAAGDIANHDHPTLGRLRVEHWDNAIAQGRHAAGAMLGDEAAYSAQPYFFTDQYDLGMEYVGHAGAADTVHLYGDVDGRVFTAYWTRDGKVTAGMHCNDWDATDRIRALVGRPADALPR